MQYRYSERKGKEAERAKGTSTATIIVATVIIWLFIGLLLIC